MGFLSAINFSTGDNIDLPCGVGNANDLQNFVAGTFYDDYTGKNWTATKSGTSIHITSSGAISFDSETIEHVLDAGDISVRDSFDGNVLLLSDFGIDPGINVGFILNSVPWFSYVVQNHAYTLTLRQGNNADAYSVGYDNANHSTFIFYWATSSNLESGILGTLTVNTYSSATIIDIFWSVSSVVDNAFQLEPGGKGFRPTGARTTKFKPGQGGRPSTGTGRRKQDPEYRSDTVTQPGAPDESAASVVKSGFLNVYKMTQSELEKVCACLYSDTLLDAIKTITVNPLDFIVSLMIFPCAPDLGSSEHIKFGKWSCIATGVPGALGTDMTGTKLAKQFKVVDFGSITIDENWGNYLDYSQTAIELYLPFIGSINIDPSECMGGTINIQYTIDFFTGQCVANVLCERSFNLPSSKLIPNRAQHSYQGNCAVQVPLSATSYGSMVGNLINACTQAITNPVSGFIGVAQDAVGGGFRPNVSSKGNIVANAGFCSVLYPYVRITRPITAEPDSYQEVMGYPSYINTTLGECEDLCVCEGIDLSGLTGATENEINRIKQLCSEGVYV